MFHAKTLITLLQLHWEATDQSNGDDFPEHYFQALTSALHLTHVVI